MDEQISKKIPLRLMRNIFNIIKIKSTMSFEKKKHKEKEDEITHEYFHRWKLRA